MKFSNSGRLLRHVALGLVLIASACSSSGDDDGQPPFDGGVDDGSSRDSSVGEDAGRDSGGDAKSDGSLSDAGDASDAKVEIIPTYIKASNTRSDGRFVGVALDGDTLAVGAIGDSSAATTVNGNQSDTSAALSGAVYVFKRTGATWAQEAYIKPSNNRAGAVFGVTLSLSGDTLAVGAIYESSASAVNPADTSAPNAGAVYVFKRTAGVWAEQAYLKAGQPRAGAEFGSSLSLKGDTLVIGASGESSSATGIDGDQANSSAAGAGAAYVFARSGTTWTQRTYVKASNSRAGAHFGSSVSLDGDSLAVGAFAEASSATGVNGNQTDTAAPGAGAAYVFTKTADTWSQQAYIKASNTRTNPNHGAGFGLALSLSNDTLAVGQYIEPSNATGVNGDQSDTSALNSGAVYVFTRAATTWSQQAYLKASNTRSLALFGQSVALSGDRLIVGSPGESSNALYVNNDQSNASLIKAGAAYEFARTGTTWAQTRYIKASNTRDNAIFGYSVAIAPTSVAIGSRFESSNATGIGGDQANTSAPQAGAVYVFP